MYYVNFKKTEVFMTLFDANETYFNIQTPPLSFKYFQVTLNELLRI